MVEDFPGAQAAMREGYVFGYDREQGAVDTSDLLTTELLQRMGMRLISGIGASDDRGDWLLTVFSATDHIPVSAVREVMALAIRKDAVHE